MDEPKLPPLDSDDNDASLGWHALNYRTAHTLHAQGMYEELERFVKDYATQAVLLERERCAKVADGYAIAQGRYLQALIMPAPQDAKTNYSKLAQMIAAAIRNP